MNCRNSRCALPVPAEANYCPACGEAVEPTPTQSMSNTGDSGGDINQYQAGRDLHFYSSSAGPSSAGTPEYDLKWSWRSPLTLAALNWVSVILGVLSLGSVYKVFEPLVSALTSGEGLAGVGTIELVWVFVLIGLILLFAIAMSLRRIARNETQHLSPLSALPAITGWGGRIGLARLRGKCTCGGRLRFYNKPVGYSSPHPQTGKQVVTEREKTAECVRDPKHHAWRVETTDRH